MFGGGEERRWLLVVAGLAPFAQEASAGAWTLSGKERQNITAVSREVNDVGQSWRANNYNELGLDGGWQINLKVETENRIGSVNESRTGIHAGVQKSFALGDRSALSVIATYLNGESLDGPDCEGEGYEARVALGTSYPILGREAFVNAEAGWKARGENCGRSVLEVTTGVEVIPRWTVMAKAWSEDGSFAHSAKVESTLLFDWDDGLSVGLGWREEVSGDFEEKGWVVSLWSRY
jgi:hypothetical protein